MPSVDRMLRSGGAKKASTTKRTTTSTGNGTSLASSVGTPRYDRSVDYQSRINAVANNPNATNRDIENAAYWERQRNQKIADMNAAGTNTSGLQQTYNYNDAPNPVTAAGGYDNKGNLYTNTSYNGSYLGIDLNKDYQADIDKYVSEGDYYKAARAEAQRNAKINYLNSIYNNPNGYQTTNNYVTNTSSNGANGQAYNGIWSYNDLKNSNLPDNWREANIGGLRYRRDDNGTIWNYTGTNANTGQEQWVAKGNRVNPNTGEWMFDDADVARQAAYDTYARATGDYNPNALGQGYIDRYQQGTQNQYAQRLADELYKRDVLAQAYQDRINRRDRNTNDGWYQNQRGTIEMANRYIDSANVSSAQREVLHTNSFETDPTLPDDYHIYGVRNYSDPYSAYIQDAYRRGKFTRR